MSAIWVTAGTADSTVTYQYDTLGRLRVVQYPSGNSITYTYDAAGNRTQVTSVGTAGPTANPDTYSNIEALLTNNGTPTVPFDPTRNDVPSTGLTVILPFGPTQNGGTVALSANNMVVYTPPNNTYSGTDNFNYTVSDGRGGTSQSTITVTMNSPPQAVDDAANNNGTARAYNFTTNDIFDPSDHLSIVAPVTLTQTQQNGTVIASGLNITYTPPPDGPNGPFHGTDTFPYTIYDGYSTQNNPHTSTATVTITVNHPCVAVDDNAIAGVGVPRTVTLDPRLNDTDVDHDTLSIIAIPNQPQYGSAQKNGKTSVTYTANPGYHGPDQFTYKINDGFGHNATATIYITVLQ
jgi:YD repeat-containing protein